MKTSAPKRQVLVHLVPELHRALKKLAAERDSTISHLVELATRRQFGFEGLTVAEAPAPYGRSEEGGRPRRPK
jgi:hypothetical protein